MSGGGQVGYFMVIREAGPAWTEGGISEQAAIGDHAAFMDALAEEGFVLFAGPLGGTEHGRLRALLVIEAASAAEIHRRLAGDPWTVSEKLRITSIEPWSIFLGARRLAASNTAP